MELGSLQFWTLLDVLYIKASTFFPQDATLFLYCRIKVEFVYKLDILLETYNPFI